LTRGHAVTVGCRLVEHGLNWQETAQLLDLSPRTLRHWRHDLLLPGPQPIALLGRPVLRSPREQRNDVIHLIDEYGPAIGVPSLRAAFPTILRAELEDLLKRYRRVWRLRHYQPIHVLHWHQPGRVWAIDYTGPLPPIEGRFPYLLAVRDLASGQQLLWLPVAEATALAAADALAGLFLIHGPPLVLKSDNGSPFTSAGVEQLAHDFGVRMLFSPPGCPRYNGAIEAGIGSLKDRTEQHAARHGRPGQWSWDDVAAARLEANATARPRGLTGPTPDELWAGRSSIRADERALFNAEVERQRLAIDAQGGPEANPNTELNDSARERPSIRRALERLDYLTYTRRRIHLPIRKKKAASIP
jgi:transposase InsO family protein